MENFVRFLSFLASWWAKGWEIISSLQDSTHIWLLAGSMAVLMTCRLLLGRSGLKWLRTSEQQETAYRYILKTAKENLISVGRHSTCPALLPEVEQRMHDVSRLVHIRILPGWPDGHVRDYLAKLLDRSPNPATSPVPTLLIGICRATDVGDVQICANERIAILSVRLGFLFNGESLCLEIRDKFFCEHVVKGVLRFYETLPQKIKCRADLVSPKRRSRKNTVAPTRKPPSPSTTSVSRIQDSPVSNPTATA